MPTDICSVKSCISRLNDVVSNYFDYVYSLSVSGISEITEDYMLITDFIDERYMKFIDNYEYKKEYIEWVNLSFQKLNLTYRKIIYHIYFSSQRKTGIKIANMIHYSESRYKTLKRQALESFIKVLGVALEEYE